jgi:hypothetical protein
MPAREAALRAGYKNCRSHYRLLGKPHVAAALTAGAIKQAQEDGKGWLLRQAIAGVANRLSRPQLRALELAWKLWRDAERKAQPAPDPVTVLTNEELNARITALARSINLALDYPDPAAGLHDPSPPAQDEILGEKSKPTAHSPMPGGA